MNGATARVVVHVAVEVSTAATWGEDCTLGQVYDQGQRAALEHVRKALAGTDARVLSATACEVVISAEAKR